MSQYIFILVWLSVMGIFGSIMPGERYENILGKRELRTTWIFAICTFIPVVIMASLRKNIGDTYAYELMFDDIPNTIDGLLSYLPQVTKDKGFTVLSGLIKIVFGNNTTIYFCILAIIQSIALIYIYIENIRQVIGFLFFCLLLLPIICLGCLMACDSLQQYVLFLLQHH